MKSIKLFVKKTATLISFIILAYLAYSLILKKPNIQNKLLTSITKQELQKLSNLNLIPEEIIGGKITLKRLDQKYFYDYHKMFSKKIRLEIEYPEIFPYHLTQNMLLYNIKQEYKGNIIVYLIFNNKNNKLIGATEIREKDIDRGQFSIWINENYWGKGFAQEAIKIISDIYFKYKDKDEYIAHVRLWNQRSYKALMKAGFKDVDCFYEDGEPTRYILKMYNPHKRKSNFTK